MAYVLQSVILLVYAYISYFHAKKPWCLPASLVLANLLTILWWHLSKTAPSKENLLFRSLIWDGLIVLIWTLLPILAFGLKISKIQKFGAILASLGFLLFSLKRIS